MLTEVTPSEGWITKKATLIKLEPFNKIISKTALFAVHLEKAILKIDIYQAKTNQKCVIHCPKKIKK